MKKQESPGFSRGEQVNLPGDGARIEFTGSRAPHVEAPNEALTLIRYATARVEAVIDASTEGE